MYNPVLYSGILFRYKSFNSIQKHFYSRNKIVKYIIFKLSIPMIYLDYIWKNKLNSNFMTAVYKKFI